MFFFVCIIRKFRAHVANPITSQPSPLTAPNRTPFWRMLAHYAKDLFAKSEGFWRFLTDQIRKKAASGAGGGGSNPLAPTSTIHQKSLNKQPSGLSLWRLFWWPYRKPYRGCNKWIRFVFAQSWERANTTRAFYRTSRDFKDFESRQRQGQPRFILDIQTRFWVMTSHRCGIF